MRKLFLSILVLLFTVGVANATGIPGSVQPKDYPVVWTETVYNGSGSSITSGYIVDWDFETSDSTVNYYDDMCPYVKLNATDEGIWTAGVVVYGQNIADKQSGQIIIKGPAYVLEGTATTVNTLCAANGSGANSPFDGGANDECALGRVIDPEPTDSGGPDGGSGWDLIYVDVTCFDEN